MTKQTKQRQFSVHARHFDKHHARVIAESSFEAAAVAYVEDLHPPGEEDEISVIVHDVESGHEHCFRIDLVTVKLNPAGNSNELRVHGLSRLFAGPLWRAWRS